MEALNIFVLGLIVKFKFFIFTSPRIKVVGSILFFQYMPVYLKCLGTIKRSPNQVTYLQVKKVISQHEDLVL